MSMVPSDPHDSSISAGGGAGDLDVERDSGVPISTQIYWTIAYQIDSGGAPATFAAASERKRPGPLVRMLVAECTTADAAYDAQKLGEAFPESVEAEGTLLDELDDRLGRFHYDLIATTTFHAAEAQLLAAGRLPVIAIMVGAGYVGLVREVANLPAGSTVGLVCATARGTDNIAE